MIFFTVILFCLGADVCAMNLTEELIQVDAGIDLANVREGDTLIFHGTVFGHPSAIKVYFWDFDGNGRRDWENVKNQVVKWKADFGLNTEISRYLTVFGVELQNNKIVTDTLIITVLFERPVAFLETDTALSINDTVVLNAQKSYAIGQAEIVQYIWDFNADSKIDRETFLPDTRISFQDTGKHAISVRVKDSKGRFSSPETGYVNVMIDPPFF
ncbi:MAG: hypothetical protein AB1633_12610, partial [Elusimicrobiota bacterium]